MRVVGRYSGLCAVTVGIAVVIVIGVGGSAGCASGGTEPPGRADAAGPDAWFARADAAPPADAQATRDAPGGCAAGCAALERCVAGACVDHPACDGAGACAGEGEICRNRRCIPEDDDPDGDGVPARDDCDESRPDVHPGATEDCGPDDLDCDGVIDEDAGDARTFFRDADGDGAGAAASSIRACSAPAQHVDNARDCDDTDPAIHPAAMEVCNGRDDDCDGTIDPPTAVGARVWFLDADGDGFGGSRRTTACRMPAGHVETGGDCDDASPAVHPGATEICNGVDDDCAGGVDVGAVDARTWYRDADGDGAGNAAAGARACAAPAGHVADSRDCDDRDAAVRPGAPEICNGADDDCNGVVDQGSTCPSGCTGATYGGHAYFACTALRTWSAAASACEARAGFRLVRVDSMGEHSFVRGRLTGELWIGGSDAATEGRWVWPDGTRFWQGRASGSAVGGAFTRWGTGEPNQDGEEDCVVISGTTWNDDECDDTHAFVCERW